MRELAGFEDIRIIGSLNFRSGCLEFYKSDLITTLIEVYNSWITEYIGNYNIAVYYMTPQNLKACYDEGKILE